MAINLDEALVNIVINIIVIAPFLWISGRALVGKEKAKVTDAIWIAVLGTVIGGIIGFLFTGLAASIIVLIIWLGLIRHFFDCGWLKALAISILAMIIFAVIVAILGAIGVGAWVWV